MHWTDDGIVLSARPHGESSAVVRLLTRGQGRHAGLVRGELVEIGARVARHGRYVTFRLTGVAVPRAWFESILRPIDDLRPRPAPAVAEGIDGPVNSTGGGVSG